LKNKGEKENASEILKINKGIKGCDEIKDKARD